MTVPDISQLLEKLPINHSITLEKFPDLTDLGISTERKVRWVIKDDHAGNNWPLYHGLPFTHMTGDATLFLIQTLERFYEECEQTVGQEARGETGQS